MIASLVPYVVVEAEDGPMRINALGPCGDAVDMSDLISAVLEYGRVMEYAVVVENKTLFYI